MLFSTLSMPEGVSSVLWRVLLGADSGNQGAAHAPSVGDLCMEGTCLLEPLRLHPSLGPSSATSHRGVAQRGAGAQTSSGVRLNRSMQLTLTPCSSSHSVTL